MLSRLYKNIVAKRNVACLLSVLNFGAKRHLCLACAIMSELCQRKLVQKSILAV